MKKFKGSKANIIMPVAAALSIILPLTAVFLGFKISAEMDFQKYLEEVGQKNAFIGDIQKAAAEVNNQSTIYKYNLDATDSGKVIEEEKDHCYDYKGLGLADYILKDISFTETGLIGTTQKSFDDEYHKATEAWKLSLETLREDFYLLNTKEVLVLDAVDVKGIFDLDYIENSIISRKYSVSDNDYTALISRFIKAMGIGDENNQCYAD